MNFGARLAEERKRIGLNQKDFAEIGGVTKTSQVNYESGERSPNVDYLQAITSAGVDVQYIITGVRLVETGENEMSKAKPPCAEISPRIAKMAELLDGLNEDQQREVFAAVAEKKRLNNLEATIADLLKRTA